MPQEQDDALRSPHLIRIGQVLRTASPNKSTPAVIDGYVNLYATMHVSEGKLVPLDSGINPMAEVKNGSMARRPAILISSSPHKVGRAETPWQDAFDSDNGYARYYGDNRTPGVDPSTRPGNRALIAAFSEHHGHKDRMERIHATPILLFRKVPRNGAQKGYAEFMGLGLITGIELVTQFSEKAGGTFSNFAFDFLILDLSKEHELLDLNWIRARRDPNISDQATHDLAPASWQRWVKDGDATREKIRRRVSKLLIEPKAIQLPEPDTRLSELLHKIYAYYDGNKHEFEALAQVIAERVVTPSGGSYMPGGLTPASADGGIDFVGRLDIGDGFGKAKLIVLGQAECEKPGSPIHGNHIARTVARLRRGWLGVCVTTSYFSPSTQREVIEDRYPIVLIPGRKLAEVVLEMLGERGEREPMHLLDEIGKQYGSHNPPSDPEDLLFR